MQALDADHFWQYALDLYAKPGVQECLLDWQNRLDKNVNLCLLLHYLDACSVALTPNQLEQLESAITELNDQALQPLRRVRAYLKKQQGNTEQYPALKKQLLELELNLERLQQRQLIHSCNQLSLTPSPAPQNLKHYLPDMEWARLADLDQGIHRS